MFNLEEFTQSATEIKNIDTTNNKKDKPTKTIENDIIDNYKMMLITSDKVISDYLVFQSVLTYKSKTQYLNDLILKDLQERLNTKETDTTKLLELWIKYKNENIPQPLKRVVINEYLNKSKSNRQAKLK